MYRVEGAHWWYRGLRAMTAQAWRRENLEDGARVIDLGCGTGAMLDAIDEAVLSVGLDVSDLALSYTKRRGIVRLIDLMPTLLDAVGLTPTSQVQGVSLLARPRTREELGPALRSHAST